MNKLIQIFKKTCQRFNKKIHNFGLSIKNEPDKVASLLVSITALIQLAFSQKHIESLVRVKLTVGTVGASNYTSGVPSIGIGMYMFMFILLGLATIFNITRAKTKKKKLIGLASIVLTLLFGMIYLLKMINPNNFVKISDISGSLTLLALGFIMYVIVFALVLYDILKNEKVL